MIEARDLSFSYGRTPVLRHVAFRVEDGQRVLLLGRSGLGKTTLLHLLCGVLGPDGGTVIVPERLGVVFQDDRLIPTLTAAENIRLASPGLTYEQLELLLHQMGLTPYRDARPGSLSGGQKRRVAIARALAFDCGALLFDEPFKGLDPATKEQVAQCILTHQNGRSLLLITHDEEDANLLGADCRRLEELSHPDAQ